MSCRKETDSTCSKCCKKNKKNRQNGAAFTEIPGQMLETREQIQNVVKIKAGGSIIMRLIKFLFKMVFRLTFVVAAAAGILYLLNKFAPDVLDSFNDWLKEQRED